MSKHRTHKKRWDRLLSGVLCLALVLGLLPAAGLIQTAEAENWADPYAEQLVGWGVMNSASDLRLDDEATRAEFVAMCNRAFGYKKLGSMPFIDVPYTEWYAEDINIAYNAGYFKGTSTNTASPDDPLTREQAAVLIARNLMLQETVGESLGFTDSRDLSEWSRGLIGAAVAEGMISGYPDGSFLPFNNITRGEVAAMLVRAIGNPIGTAGNHEMGDVYGNVIIGTSNVTLRNTVILGNLYITGGVDLGNVLLENVTVLGRIVISGGGESNAAKSSVILRNVVADELVVDSMIDQFVTISTYGLTDIPLTNVRSDAYLEDSCTRGYGLHHIELVGDSGTELQLAGSIKEVVNKTPFSLLELVKGTAETITIDEYAKGSQLVVGTGTRIDTLNLDVATLVTGDGIGQGDIINLNIGAAGCEVDILPEHVDVRPGITATVDGEKINSTSAAELSSEPRLLAGYPTATSLRPTQAEGLFSGNKPGTIYWAVSAVADGSVTAENLLNNPSYGGNILKDGEQYQSGSISANARTEYGRAITGLKPDGSYYISAILVDGRNNRSPVKVISFTTPDDTVPAFAEGYPYMSKTTCETAQVTAMANKSCTLYWVLLPAGAAVPTVQNFKSGAFGGNYGSGSMSVVKNVPVSIKVNDGRLQEKHDYDLYLWLNDFDNVMSSEVIKVVNADTNKETDPTFTTPDSTPPVVTSIRQTNFNLTDAIDFTFAINEAPSTLYWAVVTATNDKFITSSEKLDDLRVQLRVASGTGAIVSGHRDAAGANTDTEVKAGTGETNFNRLLDYKTHGTHNFTMYYVAKDAAGNYSEVKSITIHTADSEPPTVTMEFSDAMYNTPDDKAAGRKPRPQSDSNISLVFSEQIKGDSAEGAKTFVALYHEVTRYATLPDTVGSLLYNAKNTLGAELEKHFTLYYVQGRNEKALAKPKTGNQTQELYGWVDWREATVTLQPDGTVRLTLPAGKAVQLGGGMEYYFRIEDIFDDSYTSNRLVVTDDNGNIIDGGGNDDTVDLEHFTTVYAQVWLDPDETGIAKITGNSAANDSLNGIRLDIVVNAIPQSVGNKASDDCWDMVMWSDTSASFSLYRRVSADGTNWSDWVQVNDSSREINATPNVAISMSNIKGTDYLGLSDTINNNTYPHDRYETVANGLLKDVTYQYGICFTRVGTTQTDKDKEPQTWSSLVTMKFSMVAGNRTNISNLSGNVDLQYDNYVRNGSVSEIGSVRSDTSTETILTVQKQFTDKRAPGFQANSPTFTATSSTISMNVYLNRTGILYYVAIPADELYPTFSYNGKSVTVDSSKDGRSLDENADGTDKEYGPGKDYPSKDDRYNAVSGYDDQTYIPIDGTDRDRNYDCIYFASGSETVKGGVYSTPVYDDIFDGGKYAANSQYAVAGSHEYKVVTTQTVTLDGGDGQHNLKPDTWYYVYIVLRSDSGTFDDVVQVYRVKTAKVTPPAIVVNRTSVPATESGITGGSSTTGVSMTVNNRYANTSYDNPMLYYALARKDELPANFTAVYKWDDANAGKVGDVGTDGKAIGAVDSGKTTLAPDEMSVLDAIITKYGGTNLSYFDTFAGSTLKNWVRDYITTATTSNQYGSTLHGYDAVNANFKRQECLTDMQGGGEYVMLVCARHYYSTESDGTQYGFAATQGLFKPDGDPPVLIGGAGLREATITAAYKPGDDKPDSWWHSKDSLAGYTFDGSITLTFDKGIYTYENGTLKQIVGGSETLSTDDAKTQTTLYSWISSSAGVKDVTMSGNSFKIEFEKMSSGTITFPPLFNSSGVEQKEHTLSLTFRPSTTLADLEGTSYGDIGKMWMPSFRVNW